MDFSLQAFIGIDGGGSQTRALAIDAWARPLESCTVSGCNPHNIGFLAAGDRISEAISRTMDSLDSKDAEIRAVFCGIAGIRSTDEQNELAKSLYRFQWAHTGFLQIDHDLSIAYEAALGEDSGICLIAGTGAACIAKDNSGKFYTASNRLSNGNEPGSGYGVGMDAIHAGIVQSDSKSREAVSSLARSVIHLAQEGNIQAREIIDVNTRALIHLVSKVHALANLGEDFPIALTGGLATAKQLYRMLTLEKISALFPETEIRYPRMTPVEAAATLALRNYKNQS